MAERRFSGIIVAVIAMLALGIGIAVGSLTGPTRAASTPPPGDETPQTGYRTITGPDRVLHLDPAGDYIYVQRDAGTGAYVNVLFGRGCSPPTFEQGDHMMSVKLNAHLTVKVPSKSNHFARLVDYRGIRESSLAFDPAAAQKWIDELVAGQVSVRAALQELDRTAVLRGKRWAFEPAHKAPSAESASPAPPK